MDDYYNIDFILAEEEPTPIKFRVDACKLGYLDAGSVDQDMSKNGAVELPLWLARPLVLTQIAALDKSKMRGFDQRFRNDLAADATTVSFARQPYFYIIGVQLCKLLFESALAKLLQETFAARYKLLLENAHNLRGADVSEFAARLSAEERRLFAAGQRASAQLLEWRGGTRRLDASTLLGSGKRRRMQ